MNSYERESKEFLEVTVSASGEVVTEGVEFAVTSDGGRPSGWSSAEVVDGKTGVMVQGFAPGVHTVWARVTDDPEIPVFKAAKFLVV